MAIPQVISQPKIMRKLHYDFQTTNQSFLNVHYFLANYGKDPNRPNDPNNIGIRNNQFFLVLMDPDLKGVNPRDPMLGTLLKQKVFHECMYNYWYFIREVVVIPEEGGAANSGRRYELHRGNLAMNFCIIHNINIFAELPRQQGKTTAILCRLLWEFLFGTTNSKMVFINKKHEDSKMNLQSLRNIRQALPDYLRFADQYGADGKKIKVKDSVETLENPNNNNKINTLPAARNRVNANSLGRGMTIPRIWYDEYAFIPYNDIVYQSATPAFNTASMNAKRNGKPYGIIITTTPGDLTTDMGMEANRKRNLATKFSERWYDFSPQQLQELLDKNNQSTFVYIRFTYQQLGKGEEWFKKICLAMELNWTAIRREVCLEWAKVATNCPFTPEELEMVKNFVREPIRKMPMLNGMYEFNVYEDVNLANPPIAGVDVSGGMKRDSSTITLIDSATTKVFADFNCNYINTIDLARVLMELTTKYMPNVVINIERNGGFGISVIAKLLETRVKRNLFFEIKDKVIEERSDGIHTMKKTQKTKVYGTTNTGQTREIMMDILRQRVDLHKDKFISPILHSELETLEMKKNGRVEHSDNAHDDQIFSYLMAMYVWYETPPATLAAQWGLKKGTIKTDQDAEEAVQTLEDKYQFLSQELLNLQNKEDDPAQVEEQLEYLNSVKAIQYSDFLKQQEQEDFKALVQMAQSRKGRMAIQDNFHIDPEELGGNGQADMLNAINDYYNN